MITRTEYMADSANLHHAYYLEIALEAGPLMLPFTIEKIKAALANGDEHLNSLPLGSWDNAAIQQQGRMRPALQARGDGYSLGTGVCILKALAKHRATTD